MIRTGKGTRTKNRTCKKHHENATHKKSDGNF